MDDNFGTRRHGRTSNMCHSDLYNAYIPKHRSAWCTEFSKMALADKLAPAGTRVSAYTLFRCFTISSSQWLVNVSIHWIRKSRHTTDARCSRVENPCINKLNPQWFGYWLVSFSASIHYLNQRGFNLKWCSISIVAQLDELEMLFAKWWPLCLNDQNYFKSQPADIWTQIYLMIKMSPILSRPHHVNKKCRDYVYVKWEYLSTM